MAQVRIYAYMTTNIKGPVAIHRNDFIVTVAVRSRRQKTSCCWNGENTKPVNTSHEGEQHRHTIDHIK